VSLPSHRSYGLAALVLANLFCVCPCVASDYDLQDTDSFVDPRDLGAPMQIGTSTPPGTGYTLVDLSAGHIGRYQDRSIFTGEDKDFVSLGYYRYRSDMQVSGGVSLFNHNEASVGYRGHISIGKYRLGETHRSDREEDSTYVDRLLLTLTVDDQDGRNAQYEVMGSWNLELPSPIAVKPRGGMSLSFRGGAGSHLTRFIWSSTQDITRFDQNRGRFAVALTLGLENIDGQNRPAPIQAAFRVEYALSRRFEIHAAYAPAYRFAGSGLNRGTNHQWMVSFYRTFAGRVEQGGR